jgi:glutathione S-transferase
MTYAKKGTARAEKLRVHTSPSTFPNPQRLRLFALERGIEDELQEVVYDMTPGGDQRKWPHLKINPWGDAAPGARGRELSRGYSEDCTVPGPDSSGPQDHGGDAASAGAGRDVGRPYLGSHPVPHRHHVSRHAHWPRIQARADAQPTVGRAQPQGGDLPRRPRRAHLSEGRDWLLGGDEPTSRTSPSTPPSPSPSSQSTTRR